MNKAHKFKQTEIGLIPEDWEETTVGTKCKIKNGKTNTQDAVDDGKYPLYDRSTQIKRSNKFLFDTEAVIIPGEGKEFIPKYYKGKFDLHQRAYAIWSENDDINIKYVYYWIERNKIYLSNIAVGSTVKSLRLNHLENFPLCLPQDIREENQIAKILSDLDSKIELLQKQNETLEKIGQAIFKHWFVDFEFPDEEGKPYKSSGGKMVESELGEIPEGWSVGKLGDFVESVSGCSYTSKGLEESEKALVTLKSISVSGFTQEGFKEYTGDYKDKHVVKDGDIVVAHTDLTQNRIILGKPAVVRDLGKYEVMIASMDLSIVRPTKLLNRPYLFYLLSTHMFHSHAQGYSNGTTVIHLSRKAVPEFPFIIPSEEILNNFKEFSNYLFDKISINQKSIKSLEKSRDLLLPKLMTGKIRVPLEVEE